MLLFLKTSSTHHAVIRIKFCKYQILSKQEVFEKVFKYQN